MDRRNRDFQGASPAEVLLKLASVNVLLGAGLSEVPPAERLLLKIPLKDRTSLMERHRRSNGTSRGWRRQREK